MKRKLNPVQLSYLIKSLKADKLRLHTEINSIQLNMLGDSNANSLALYNARLTRLNNELEFLHLIWGKLNKQSEKAINKRIAKEMKATKAGVSNNE
jgi:hypothetical protein